MEAQFMRTFCIQCPFTPCALTTHPLLRRRAGRLACAAPPPSRFAANHSHDAARFRPHVMLGTSTCMRAQTSRCAARMRPGFATELARERRLAMISIATFAQACACERPMPIGNGGH
jgi:hypothetical protein